MTKKKADELNPRRVVKDTNTLWAFPCKTTLTGVIEYLQGEREKHGEDADIEFAVGDDEPWGSSGLSVNVISYRDETPTEIEKRIAKAKKSAERAVVQRIKNQEKQEKQKKKDEQAELNLLKRLQKKYSGYTFENINPEG